MGLLIAPSIFVLNKNFWEQNCLVFKVTTYSFSRFFLKFFKLNFRFLPLQFLMLCKNSSSRNLINFRNNYLSILTIFLIQIFFKGHLPLSFKVKDMENVHLTFFQSDLPDYIQIFWGGPRNWLGILCNNHILFLNAWQ